MAIMNAKKILFCSPNPISTRLGAAKVLVELSQQLTQLGWHCDWVEPATLLGDRWHSLKGNHFRQIYQQKLTEYLQAHLGEYDVIDCDYGYLPNFQAVPQPNTLMVARSVLLIHHLATANIPKIKGSFSFKATIPSTVKSLLFGAFYQAQLKKQIETIDRSLQTIDLMNVSNHRDKSALVQRGIPAGKVVVFPFGLTAQRRSEFAPDIDPPAQPVVAFVGTFDPRKGATDFPAIVERIVQQVPTVRFRLLGTAGLYRTQAEVIAYFPRHLRSHLEVMEQFDPAALPTLLQDCSLGIFPSYIEGFGFGVLEMLAAALPIIAYDAPGPPMMLLPEHLVPPGDVQALVNKVVHLLTNHEALVAARHWAQLRSQAFRWEEIAAQTSDLYLARLEQIRRNQSRKG